MDYRTFKKIVLDYYHLNRRHFPWRELSDDVSQRFYEVLVSEVMLQQTQVGRVVEKYNQWMSLFPTADHAARASFVDILLLWQGLGYNRRARYLYDSIRYISTAPKLPSTIMELVALPGVGENTAGAILAYCYNKPSVFIETNIRTVYMYHFPELGNKGKVKDSAIRDMLESSVDKKNPREWYWALMDYGTFLKCRGFNNHASSHYVLQTKFEGSMRQLRARIVREVLKGPKTADELEDIFMDPRVKDAVASLLNDQTLDVMDKHIMVSQGSVK